MLNKKYNLNGIGWVNVMNRNTWDKWVDSNWFLRVVALLLAIMLFISATWEGQIEEKSLLGSRSGTETVTNVPLELYYDQENLVVTGAPTNVTVDLTGPTNITKSASLQKQFSVFADLRDLPLGTHTVNLGYRNISEKLSVNISPESITVNIQEKITKEFEIEVDYINRNQMEAGFSVGSAKVNPERINITGAKDRVEKIALVKSIVDLDGVNESFKTNAKVLVYDAEGNQVDVELEYETVEIQVEVIHPYKEFPLELTIDKPLADAYALVSVHPETEIVTMYGRTQKILEDLEPNVKVGLDLSAVKKTGNIEVSIPVPKGVVSVSPQKLTVLVTVEKKVEKVFKNIKIQVDDLSSDYSIEFLQPQKGTVDVTVVGAPTVVNNLKSKDIVVYFSVIGKGTGTHQSELKIKTLDQVELKLANNQVEYELK